MLQISSPDSRFPKEYRYIVDMIFGHYLHMPYAFSFGSSGKWVVTVGDKQLCFPNLFFTPQWPRDWKEVFPSRLSTNHVEGITGNLVFPFALPDATAFFDADVFGSIFFFVTSFEDELGLKKEFTGSLHPAASFIVQQNLSNRPLVDEYIEELSCKLASLGYNSNNPRSYNFYYSCDVDVPAQWYRANFFNFCKSCAAAVLKHRSLMRLQAICSAYNNLEDDLFYTFPWIMEQLEKNGLSGCFNFKGGGRNPHYDSYYSLNMPWLASLMKQLTDRGHEIGFHPSYDTPAQQDMFHSELSAVRKASQFSIKGGRQHYLRFLGGTTWKMWNDAGLEYDSTVAFNRISGFRLGISREYPVFDLASSEPLQLLERPLILMDDTLLGYEALPLPDAYNKAIDLNRTVRKYGGDMTLLWHNSYLETPEKKDFFCSLLQAFS